MATVVMPHVQAIPALQDWDWMSGAVQLPPFDSGVTTVRRWLCVPSSQGRVQSDHALQSDSTQSTGHTTSDVDVPCTVCGAPLAQRDHGVHAAASAALKEPSGHACGAPVPAAHDQPAGQAVGTVEPGPHDEPAGHGVGCVAPAPQYAPAGHGVGALEFAPQYEPAGHATGAPVAPLPHEKPAGQVTGWGVPAGQ